jgi:hypothetical protein
LLLSIVTGGDLLSDIIGIGAGHLYFYLKDMAPLHHGMDILKTPQFLYIYINPRVNYFDRRPGPRSNNVSQVNNPNASSSFGNSGPQQPPREQSSFRQEPQERGNAFTPFSGRGNTWGS